MRRKSKDSSAYNEWGMVRIPTAESLMWASMVLEVESKTYIKTRIVLAKPSQTLTLLKRLQPKIIKFNKVWNQWGIGIISSKTQTNQCLRIKSQAGLKPNPYHIKSFRKLVWPSKQLLLLHSQTIKRKGMKEGSQGNIRQLISWIRYLHRKVSNTKGKASSRCINRHRRALSRYMGNRVRRGRNLSLIVGRGAKKSQKTSLTLFTVIKP
jgi:hypothetical protein